MVITTIAVLLCPGLGVADSTHPVARDAAGCLQDIHWSLGTIGYFPAYSPGNLNAAQLIRQAQNDCPALEMELAQGKSGTLLGWLRDQIHRHGMKHPPQKLMRLANGEGAGTTARLPAPRQKYGQQTAPKVTLNPTRKFNHQRLKLFGSRSSAGTRSLLFIQSDFSRFISALRSRRLGGLMSAT